MAFYDYFRLADEVGFDDLDGKVIESIDGLEIGNDDVTIRTSDGDVYRMFHAQDCCECVDILDICGDVKDIIGAKVISARCDSNSDGQPLPDSDSSFTWTFYNIQTSSGHVQIRWYGSSNGYYSEDVYFYKMKKPS